VKEKIKSFVDRNPVRIAAFVSSAVALFVSFLFPDVPTEAAVAFVLSSLGLGEFAQRKENAKTEAALLTEVSEVVVGE
jgi:hypothetical protein